MPEIKIVELDPMRAAYFRAATGYALKGAKSALLSLSR